MSKKAKEYGFMIVLTLGIICCGILISKTFIRTPEIPTKEKQIASINEKTGTEIQKLETEDYYYYTVEDFDRELSYSWKFQKEKGKNISVEESLNIDADLRLSLNAITKDTQEIENRVEQNKLIITFDHHGELPLEATVKLNVKKRFANHEKLYLYYYNPEEDQIEYIAHNVEVKDGYVEFTISHCSDYFLTAAVVNDAVGNPKSLNYIIIGLVVIVFILIAVTLVQSKNK
ncbi:MAG: hypothetical protein HFH86_00875 [Bacilli bacterium]|nr:hypothetical protein [Bacilli bacterium]